MRYLLLGPCVGFESFVLFLAFSINAGIWKYLGSAKDSPVVGVKNYNMCVFFDKICVSCDIMCVICSKVKFIINITQVTGIHIFYFYNNKHIFTITDTTFTTKHTYFIKINTGPVTGPKCDPAGI
jgi:hypothetical protein